MKILCCNITQWHNFEGLQFLNADRKQKFERYMQPKDKLRCLVGGLLLYFTLGHNKPPLYNIYGKPYFEHDLCFNISHAGDYVVLATSTHAIGIDVENTHRYNKDIAAKCFTAQEIIWLKENESPQAFFKLWTAKESIMKAVGCGFNLNPSSFNVLPICNGEHSINNQTWFLYWHSLQNHELCIASANACTDLKITHLAPSQILNKLEALHNS